MALSFLNMGGKIQPLKLSNSKSGSQSGNVIFLLFATIGMVGVVGAASMSIMKGPVKSMGVVTKRTIAENNMIASGKLAIIATSSQPLSGDCDADNKVEPVGWSNTGTGPKPAGGGYLPTSIGAALQDPWQTTYGYCAWDHGAAIKVAGCGTAPFTRLAGNATANGTVVAIISAGPDRIFQTSCGDAPTFVTRVAGSDDVVMTYTYDEAQALSAGLWNLQAGNLNTAEIKKDLEVKNASNTVVFGVDATTDAAKPSIKVDYIKALSQPEVSVLSPLRVTEFARGQNAQFYSGWGIVAPTALQASDLELSRPGTPTVYRISNHTGLSFSAHTSYGGIRFYNQGYNAGDNYGTLKSTTGATLAMSVNGGFVGIGTATPTLPLEVVGPASSHQIRIKEGTSGNRWTDLVKRSNAFGAPNSFSIFQNDGSAYTQGLTISQTGDVGFGTETPISKLDVRGLISGGFGANSTAGVANWNDNTNSRSGGSPSLLLGSATNGPTGTNNYFHPFNFEYSAKDGTGQVTQLAIPYSDSATQATYGIFMRGRYSGAWSPWKELGDDLGDHTATQALNMAGQAITSSAGTIRDAGGGWIRTYGNTGWYSQTYGGGWYMVDTTWVRSYSGKNVHTPGTMQADTNMYSGAYYYTSDKRLKENIKPVQSSRVDDLYKLQGYTFDWKKDKSHDIGLIAQEVETYFPELVAAGGVNDMKAVKYGNLVPLLLEAAKEQKKEIDTLKQKLGEGKLSTNQSWIPLLLVLNFLLTIGLIGVLFVRKGK